MPADLSKTRVVIVVFAMPSCPACHEYLPKLEKQIHTFQEHGHPFLVWSEGMSIEPGTIPILIYDVTKQDQSVQEFADKFDVKGLPTTIFLPRIGGWHKLEGSQDDTTIYNLLTTAVVVNR